MVDILVQFFTQYAGYLVAISLFIAVLTLVLIPILIIKLPADYFLRANRKHRTDKYHPLITLSFIAVKNLLGVLFLLLGFVLLFLPGQGLLLIFAGLLIMNYPGKYKLECWLVKRRGVLRALNAIRVRKGKPALLLP